MNYFKAYGTALRSKTYLSIKKRFRKVGLKKIVLSCFALAAGIACILWDLSENKNSFIKKLLNTQGKSNAEKILNQMEAQSGE
jgi:hypothetical protein